MNNLACCPCPVEGPHGHTENAAWRTCPCSCHDNIKRLYGLVGPMTPESVRPTSKGSF